MDTNRKGILTEYRSPDGYRKEEKKSRDVSYLFSDDYDETKTPMHYTKRRSAWTASFRRRTMHQSATRLGAYHTAGFLKPTDSSSAETKVIKSIPVSRRQPEEHSMALRSYEQLPLKNDPQKTKVIRKVVTQPVPPASVRTPKKITEEQQRQTTSAIAETVMIAATRAAAVKTEKKQAPSATSSATKKKIFWPYMVMIVSVVFIASLVTFLYLIQSSDSHFFMSIRDKDAPILQVTDLDIYNEQTVTVDDFIVACDDDSRVKVYLQSPIDYSVDGDQMVTIVAEDEVGNKTMKSATLCHIIDETPPRIAGDPVIRTVRGESIAYKSHISVIDDHDSDPVIEIDNSAVNLDMEGSYAVYYYAKDKCGNQSVFQSEVVVSAPSNESVSDEEVYALVDQILSDITTEDMQPIDKLWAIYEYIRHLPYMGRDYSFNYKYEGYKLLRDQKGECYGSFSAAKLFFDRLGYENLSLEKNVGPKHYWNMVSIDGGETFYHFDATNWHEWAGRKPVMCMISDAALEQISEAHKGTHRYDHALFPSTPAESLPVPDYVPSKFGEDY